MIRVTILGCGSSGGVPRLGDRWGACDPANPKNRRRRCSLLVERIEGPDVTRVLIDTGPDFVAQMLDAGVAELQAVLYTHAHADHIHGIDDLRQIAYNMGQIVPVWADQPTADALMGRFGYIFETPEGSHYPPVCEMNLIDGPIEVDGPAGPLRFLPFEVDHGGVPAQGFRIEGDESAVVYLPDVLTIPGAAWQIIGTPDLFICDGLRYAPHPSHAHLALALDWIAQSGARRGVITNMHIDLDHDAVERETPAHVNAAYDGMVIDLP